MTNRNIGNRLSKIPYVAGLRRFVIANAKLPETRFALLEGMERLREFRDSQHEVNQALLDGLASIRSYVGNVSRTIADSSARSDAASREANQLARGISDRLAEVTRQLTSLDEALSGHRERAEFIRREMMYEFRYQGDHAESGGSKVVAGPRIVDEERVARLRETGLRINLGCGHHPLAEHVNVDSRDVPGVDVVADVSNLPFGESEITEIYSAHLLEHFPEERLRRQLLPMLRSLLVADGTFRAVVPDAEAMLREHAAGRFSFDDLKDVTFGAQDYDGDFHFTMFTPASLSAILADVGFEDVRVVESGRRNGRCYEFEIVASRGARASTDAV